MATSVCVCVSMCVSVCVCVCVVLVAVVVEAVVAAQSGQSSQPDGVGEEDLSAGVNPHLRGGQRSEVRGQVCDVFKASFHKLETQTSDESSRQK